ncbi:hypothetical protein K469DRAFT_105890 [Zopfia rhizophila CBS 207.26]|uniref:Uncharacterized protein n=1 Tax=Zopfia rhizophila CBS 207.26 TaxID=1314779 RepID=A0A6A6ED45_9PEZI|nr:hypothetical protein K469DRAFT_105890 [Zopfia rhizophila CBS 207.26]
MPYFYDANEAPYQNDLEEVSPDRPPQRNTAVCGCRCGCGCGILEGSESGNNDDDDQDFPLSSDGPEAHVKVAAFEVRQPSLPSWNGEEIREVRTRYGGYLNGTEGFRLSQHVVGKEEDHPMWCYRGRNLHDHDDASDSMKNEPHGSDDHSTVTSEVISVRCMSPGPGLGTWAEDPRMSKYHFLATPLRLTPQLRYCRGLVASHLILED